MGAPLNRTKGYIRFPVRLVFSLNRYTTIAEQYVVVKPQLISVRRGLETVGGGGGYLGNLFELGDVHVICHVMARATELLRFFLIEHQYVSFPPA